MRNFESEWDSTSKFGVEFLGWIGLFCPDFDFIRPYFDLISLAPQPPRWIYVSNSARNRWTSSEFYSQIWVDFPTLKGVFLRDFDFIRAYFGLISLAPQLFLSILLIRENIRRMTGPWRPFCHSNSQPKSFIDAEWTGFLFSHILFILFILFWFISLILLIFIDILKLADWPFPANLGGCVAFTQ